MKKSTILVLAMLVVILLAGGATYAIKKGYIQVPSNIIPTPTPTEQPIDFSQWEENKNEIVPGEIDIEDGFVRYTHYLDGLGNYEVLRDCDLCDRYGNKVGELKQGEIVYVNGVNSPLEYARIDIDKEFFYVQRKNLSEKRVNMFRDPEMFAQDGKVSHWTVYYYSESGMQHVTYVYGKKALDGTWYFSNEYCGETYQTRKYPFVKSVFREESDSVEILFYGNQFDNDTLMLLNFSDTTYEGCTYELTTTEFFYF